MKPSLADEPQQDLLLSIWVLILSWLSGSPQLAELVLIVFRDCPREGLVYVVVCCEIGRSFAEGSFTYIGQCLPELLKAKASWASAREVTTGSHCLLSRCFSGQEIETGPQRG